MVVVAVVLVVCAIVVAVAVVVLISRTSSSTTSTTASTASSSNCTCGGTNWQQNQGYSKQNVPNRNPRTQKNNDKYEKAIRNPLKIK